LHAPTDRLSISVRSPASLNSIGLIRRFAAQGLGIALLPEGLCREDVEAGRLARVLEDWSPPRVPIYALTATRLLPAKTRVFIDFVQALL
jgi:DNA-binding transcriptional LysR family regulator